jgi:hypothetical protein
VQCFCAFSSVDPTNPKSPHHGLYAFDGSDCPYQLIEMGFPAGAIQAQYRGVCVSVDHQATEPITCAMDHTVRIGVGWQKRRSDGVCIRDASLN